MRVDTLHEAVGMAERFLELATEVLLVCDAEGNQGWISGTKMTGATQRASMELTRKLADLRAGR
jgi:hypothetical protein